MHYSQYKQITLITATLTTLIASFTPVSTCFALSKTPSTLSNSVQSTLKNWGLNNSEDKSHIQATEAWKIEEGNSDIVVAVIDTGVDAEHLALSKNILHASQKNQLSPYGWNFVSNQPNPTDEHGHGTHIAGIIGALSDPVSGVSGVAHHVSILPVKYYSESNSGATNLKHTIEAIRYAIKNKVRIINYSGGGPEFSQEEYLAIKEAEANGILFVSAAGNEHQDSDRKEHLYYPAAYRLSNIISVGATNIHNELLPSSNWGKHNVDVAAPGENIYSTLPGGRYGYMTGTSQATAFVTGIAALLLSQDPTLTPQQVKEIIVSSVDPISSLRNKIAAGGRVNAYQALLSLKNRKMAFNPRPKLSKNLANTFSEPFSMSN